MKASTVNDGSPTGDRSSRSNPDVTDLETSTPKHRRRRGRAALILVGVVAAAVGLAACGGSSDKGSGSAGGSGKKVAFGFPATEAPIYAPLLQGARQAATARGYQLLESHANMSASTQLDELNVWNAEKVAGVIVAPVDLHAMGPITQRLRANGVTVLSYANTALPGTKGWVIFNNAQGAKLVGDAAGRWVNEKLGGRAKVALLTNNQQESGRERIAGAVAALRAVAPNAEVVAQHEGSFAADTFTVFRSMLQANPDINVVFCIADDGCLGAEKAFMETQPTQARQDKMFMGGWDGSLPVLKEIASGKSVIRATGALDAIGIGHASIEATINAIEGKSPTKINYPYVLVDQSNPALAAKFIRRYEAAAK